MREAKQDANCRREEGNHIGHVAEELPGELVLWGDHVPTCRGYIPALRAAQSFSFNCDRSKWAAQVR
jgi:hypothetical protein